jgi:FAD/FMN-containing dehydrogenase
MNIPDFGGEVVDPAHPDFHAARFGWNHMIDRKPALIARCTNAADVVAAVLDAGRHDMKAVARCGGHSVSGASLPEGGMVIDLVGLKSIEVDPAARIARVGGGVLLGELDAATQAFGLAVTAGVEPDTGVGGLTLGGGIGFLCRKLGLAIDSLMGAEIVLADGSQAYASENEHPDLFWAIRGGGGQFGIVTRFDFRVHPIGPEITTAQAYYPLEKAREVMRYVRGFMHGASEDVTLVPAFMKVPPVEPFPPEWHGKPCLAVVACHVGEHMAAKEELQPMLELGGAIFGFVDTTSYVEFQKTFAGASPKGGRFYWKSIFVDDLTDDLVDVMADGISTLPGDYTMIFMETLGGAVSRVGVEETAFSNRTALYNLGLSAGWVNESDDGAIVTACHEWFERLKPFSDGTVYLNYLDRDEIGRTEKGFGPNFSRLKEVKERYDPKNRFGGAMGGAG